MNFNPIIIVVNPKKLLIKSKNVKPHRNCSTFAVKFLKTKKYKNEKINGLRFKRNVHRRKCCFM